MSRCRACAREMLDEGREGCLPTLLIGGKLHNRLPHGTDAYDVDDCNDCGVQLGAVHHVLCDRERCPVCGGQLIACEHAPPLDAIV
jgi:hypothetical protein